jgi:hypothetical protein
VTSGLEVGFELDKRWHWLRGEMDESKKPALLELARVLAQSRVQYAVIVGIAMQVHQDEPRTTLDIDVAVRDRASIPAAALTEAGFRRTGTFEHSDNWIGPGATPVQFTDDPELYGALTRTVPIAVDGVVISILCAEDLLHAKLRAAADPARRRSKRLQDLADAHSLLEKEPSIGASLSAAQQSLLDRFGP